MGIGGIKPAQKLKWPREFYRGAPLKTGGLPLDVAEKTTSLVGIWSALVSQAALVEVIDRMLELGPSIADTLSKSSPMWLRRNAMHFPRSVDRSRLISKVSGLGRHVPGVQCFLGGNETQRGLGGRGGPKERRFPISPHSVHDYTLP
ncbi:hypothetical protein AS026_03465 [Rhizobium altiplani]|uniref:Uncharacterized protein n=1 Tax=Rhizobium altiplani TaxID=1864509 RepID=A0A120FMF4_9HYPH|nr:hypothetical protein AS026_03465 [Rhizobium altiplani]